MSDAATLRQVLDMLGIDWHHAEERDGDQDREIRARLHLANALLGAAEHEVRDAEHHTTFESEDLVTITDSINRLSDRSFVDPGLREPGDLDDELILIDLMRWRASRLWRSIGILAGGGNRYGEDPLLDATIDAAATTLALLAYRGRWDLALIAGESSAREDRAAGDALTACLGRLDRIAEVLHNHLA